MNLKSIYKKIFLILLFGTIVLMYIVMPSVSANPENVTKDLNIQADTSAVEFGNTTDVTFFVTRPCGSEPDEACIAIYPPIRLPVSNANVHLEGAASGDGVTNSDGTVIISITPSSEGVITAIASKDGYTDASTIIHSAVAQTPTPNVTTPVPNETTPVPNETTPTPTPTPTCLDIIKQTQIFNSTVGEDVTFKTGDLSGTGKTWNVTWYIDSVKFKTDYNIANTATYYNSTSTEGSHTISAVAGNGCDKMTWNWAWNVSQPKDVNIENPTKSISSVAGETVYFSSGNLTSTNKTWNFIWYFNRVYQESVAGPCVVGVDSPCNNNEVFNESNIYQSFYSKESVAGTWNISVIAKHAGNSIRWSWVWTVNPKKSSPNGGGGGGSGGSGGGGGGVTSAEKYTNIVKFESKDSSLKVDTPVSYTFRDSIFSIYQVDVTGKSNEGDITLRIEHLKNVSSLVSRNPAGIIYANENLLITSKKVAMVKISFRVNNSWISNNNLAKEDIKLLHWNNGWNKLNTKVISSDNSYTYFQASAPKLSSFAISGLKEKSSDNTENNTLQSSQIPEDISIQNTNITPMKVAIKNSILGTKAIVLILIIAILAIINIRRKK